MEGRVVLHSDLNNCYASIECMLHPELRGKYIAVCGSTEDRHGIVLAKNQLAKQCGVKTGEVIWEAKQKCPQLTIVEPHMEQYLKFSKIVRSIYLRYSPEVESFGIDESWIELTGSPLLQQKTPLEIANEIRTTVKEEVGLTVSIGVSFNKIFAKLGSDMKKPDAVTVITRESFKDQIWSLPVSDLLYVGRATMEKIRLYGIRTIGDLAQADRAMLIHRLGVNGEKLWVFANGLDQSRVMPCDYEIPIKSVGHGITCTDDLLSKDEVRHVLMELSQEVGLKLRKNSEYCVRGCTALLDAIGGAIHHIGNVHKYAREEDVPAHTLFVITTDGMENASRLYDSARVKQMIEHEKSKYGWEFLFLGANIDAVETAKHFGISEDRAVNYHSDSVGTRLNYEVVSCAITSMRSGAPMSADWKAPIEADYKTRKGEKN